MRERVFNGELIETKLDTGQCAVQRDTLAKQLYQRNFEWLVRRLNENTDNSGESRHSIFMLDIFGFEVFELNYFEQFCINYANGNKPLPRLLLMWFYAYVEQK